MVLEKEHEAQLDLKLAKKLRNHIMDAYALVFRLCFRL